MSGYSADVVKQKLSALNETQESIMTTAQWLMFHKRYAQKTAELWLHKVKDQHTNAGKKVNLIYLANEIVQQSKAKKKEEFPNAFSPFVGEAIIVAYKGAPSDVQHKLKRVAEVWRQRQVFDQATQEAIEAQIIEVDKNKPQGHRKQLGGSLFPSDSATSTPVELQPLARLQHSLSKAQLTIRPALDPANKAYTALTTGTAQLPSPPLYAGRLSSLARDLAAAEKAVSDTLKTRKELIASLVKLLATNRAAVTEEEKQLNSLRTRHTEVESKKRDVDDAIMRGDSTSEYMNDTSGPTDFHLGQRPEIERFTPPPPSPVPANAQLLVPIPKDRPTPPAMPVSFQQELDAEPRVTAEDLARSTTPPSYQHGRGNNGAFFQGDGTFTPEEISPLESGDIYGSSTGDGQAAADAFLENLTPPPTFTPEPYSTAFAPAPPPTNGHAPHHMPGLGAAMPPPNANLDPRKRTSSAISTGNRTTPDPRRRLNSSGSSPTKRQRTSEDDFAGLPGLGGEGGLEGLDVEVVGMLGS